MLALFVSLAMGLLFAVCSSEAHATEAVYAVVAKSKPASAGNVQTAVWKRSQAVPVQSVGWGRWRSNRWYYSSPYRYQTYRSVPAQSPVARPAQPKAAAPAPVAAAPPTKPATPAPQAGQSITPAESSTHFGTTLPPEQQLQLHDVEMNVIEDTNRQRARYGLRPLRVDLGLVRSARRHTQWMTRNHAMQHTSAPVAENIAMGQNSPTEVLNAWMNSSGHRANILNAGYTRIGVAAYRTPQGTIFWCQQFLR
ncbi:MAG TPA: CAP domain-containing protein [Pirellulales bacterium]|nr:CAP domain-containing protein [Pirellulales bacterium]